MWRTDAIGRWVLLACALSVSGCATWASPIRPPPAVPDDCTEGCQAVYLDAAPPVAQRRYQCGPAAMASVLRYWGQNASAETIARELYTPGTRGILNFLLAQYAREHGWWAETRTGASAEELEGWLRQGIPPIVMLRVGPRWMSSYHLVVLKGCDASDAAWYANMGTAETWAIRDRQFRDRWKDAGRWYLIVSPPERVNWALDARQAADLGLLLERAGRFEAAEERYRQALAQQPDDPTIRFRLANVYLSTHRLAEAKTMYRRLLDEQPYAGSISNNLAWISVQEGKPLDAIHLIDEAFQHGAAQDYAMLDTLGWAYCRAGQAAAAAPHLEKALALVPADRQVARDAIQEHVAACRNEAYEQGR